MFSALLRTAHIALLRHTSLSTQDAFEREMSRAEELARRTASTREIMTQLNAGGAAAAAAIRSGGGPSPGTRRYRTVTQIIADNNREARQAPVAAEDLCKNILKAHRHGANDRYRSLDLKWSHECKQCH